MTCNESNEETLNQVTTEGHIYEGNIADDQVGYGRLGGRCFLWARYPCIHAALPCTQRPGNACSGRLASSSPLLSSLELSDTQVYEP